MADLLVPNENSKAVAIQESKSMRDNPFYQAIVKDIIVPTAMNTLYDIGHSLLNRLCYGSFSNRKGGYRAGRDDGYISYNTYYKDDRRSQPERTYSSSSNRADPYRGRADATVFSFADLFEVETALDEMATRLQCAHKLTVADMYDIAQVSSMPTTAHNFGWTDISKVQKSRDPNAPDRWIIVMPKPKDIRNI